ncbi:zinc ribbon domain-containing protein [Rhizobium gallicum]|nr:zinc ribbon domain-containing protein [Rhizobium gallicum]
MTLRTGKSGRYRYYTCPTCAQRGKTACKGRSVPMAELDDVVTAKLAEDLLTPARVATLLAKLMERHTARETDHAQRLTALREKLADCERRLGRLYEIIENGMADPSDPTLKERIAAVKTERDIAQVAFDRAVAELRPDARITADKIAVFTQVMQENIRHGEIPFRRAYIRAVADQVEVDDTEIGIHGGRSVLERLVMGGGATPAGVPSFVRKWRA